MYVRMYVCGCLFVVHMTDNLVVRLSFVRESNTLFQISHSFTNTSGTTPDRQASVHITLLLYTYLYFFKEKFMFINVCVIAVIVC